MLDGAWQKLKLLREFIIPSIPKENHERSELLVSINQELTWLQKNK